MALKFGPQWLRDLSDGGTGTSQPSTPTTIVKFKLSEYRYGREEMLALFINSSPPPDQVRKHLSIFSKEIQKPICMSPLTEDEQRLISQGFNSTVVLRAAGRGTGPPLRTGRGGGLADRGRGRGRGRGEGYISRAENGDVGYSRSTQDGWEHVGRKFERSYSRGYDENGPIKREYLRSSSDNWRDKRHDEDEEDEISWRNNRENNSRWGPLSRSNWREPQRDLTGFEGDRRPALQRRGFDQEQRGSRRTSESYDHEGEVPEWVEDDVGDDPGTFDSSGAFVSTKHGRRHSDTKNESSSNEGNEKKKGDHNLSQIPDHPSGSESPEAANIEKVSCAQTLKPVYVPPNARNGTGDANDSSVSYEQQKPRLGSQKGKPDSFNGSSVANSSGHSNKGAGDSGFAFPNKEEANGTTAPPGQYANLTSHPHMTAPEQETRARLPDPNFMQIEKLQNLVADMRVDAENKEGRRLDVSQTALPLTHDTSDKEGRRLDVSQAALPLTHENSSKEGRRLDVSQDALPLNHENSNKWFYKDPQGEIQGPFSSDEMAQWFSAGYFTMSLVVKRGCDDSFKQLGELIKRYGRIPFSPGPPLPPLVSSNAESTVISTPPPTIPTHVSPLSVPPLLGPGLSSVHDPLLLPQMLLQQEYLKQTFIMRQMHMQTLQQMQEQENFKTLPLDQQQHLSMQMMMQANPVFMQHLQQLQQQQQQLLLQHQQQEQHRTSPVNISGEGTVPFSQSQPSIINTSTLTTNIKTPDLGSDDTSVWGTIQQRLGQGLWPPASSQPTSQPPLSLWDVDSSNENLSPAYLSQMEKMKMGREEEERLLKEQLENKQEDIRRQQEELERQREQMRREKEELERQKQIELQKIEESRRQEEERVRQEIERQQKEQLEEEQRRQEGERKRQEEERKRERELKKQEEKKRKEEEKRRQQEEQKRQQEEQKRRQQEELKKRKQEEELQWQQEQRQLQSEQDLQRQLELQQQQEEEERMQRELAAAERERMEAHKRQQMELQRQQESLRWQKEQLANMQLPPTSNWAAQQQQQGSPPQSRSLTEIQEEEARKEEERQKELQLQMQRMQEQTYLMNQQHQQKSWAVHASQGVPVKGMSLLDIQQEQENARKTQEKPNNQTYQAKLSQPSSSSWIGSSVGGTWGTPAAWSSGSSNTSGFWDQVVVSTTKKTTLVKESGEFPALKTPAQQAKKNAGKPNKTKATGAKQKKEEESVQKLFQTRQQDDFSQWVTERVAQFSAPIDVPMFVSFIVEVDSPDDVREYMKIYLGDNKESKEFARQFVDKRNHFRNQARLEKQQEENSIWGPAPAVNPHHNQLRGGTGGGGGNNNSTSECGESGSGKGKNRKKKQKMQKLDGSILGFTVHADPNRKNAAGEVESIQ